MRRTFDNSVVIGLGLLVALLVASAGLAYRNTWQLNEDARWVAHTHDVLDQIDDVMAALLDAETGQRGFLITGRNEFLEPHDAAVARLDELCSRLEATTADNSGQQARVRKLREMTAVRLTLLKEGIDSRRKSMDEAAAFVAAGKGKAQMDAVRRQVDEMEKTEEDLLKERKGKTAAAYRVALLTGLFASLLGLLTIAAFILLLHRSLRVRQHDADAIAEQAERLRTTLASIGDAVIATDVAGRITTMNAVAETLTGWAESQAIGQPLDRVFNIVNADTHVPVENPATRALKEGRIVGLANHTVLIAKDGTQRPIDDSAAPIRCRLGEIVGCVLVFRDVTERQRAEALVRERAESLRKLSAELSEADRRKNEFLAMLAHELRNPLAPLRNGLEIMRLSGNTGPAVEQSRAMMERQLAQMVHLVDDLLDVSRISQGKVELRRERVSLEAVLRTAVEDSKLAIESGGQELTLSMPSEPIFVDADVIRLGQVFSNLLSNSAKFGQRGGRIRVTAERMGSDVAVSVKDTGIGIPPEMLPRVFDLFTQVDRTLERSKGGLGIGLTLAKRLVEQHGGSIAALSEGRGTGSEFRVRLPVAATVRPETPTGTTPSAATPPPGTPRRILVADDNVDSAASLATMLQLMGSEVRTANDGLSALRMAEEFRPEVILLDIGMPKLNGYEVCRRIRELPWGRAVVMIALTGWGQDENKRQSRDAGFDHHLVKPVDPPVLEKVLAGSKA